MRALDEILQPLHFLSRALFARRRIGRRTRLRSQKAMICSRRLLPHSSVFRGFLSTRLWGRP